ncbi:MAG: flavodoxin domain-containing protein [Xanthomonadales bacterium]|nr:flavodoxin domain-containing protein [Xanthomonadales bacterium]
MSALPRLPDLLPPENAEALARAVAGVDAPALWWMSGYLAGLAHTRGPVARETPHRTDLPADVEPEPVAESRVAPSLTIVYGSQTGNAKRVAEQWAAQIESAGLRARVLRADAYPLRELKDEKLLGVVISTQGEGDPPEDSFGLFEFLDGRRAPNLAGLKFAVLALGDSSYPQFCAVGHRLDARLAELGAERLHACTEVDVDIEAVAAPWRNDLTARIKALQPSTDLPRASVTPLRRAPSPPAVDRDHPASLTLLAQQRIVGRHSEKDVRHLEFDLAASGLRYEPGDALGIWPRQPDAVVDDVLAAAGLTRGAMVELDGQQRAIESWLAEYREAIRPGKSLLAALAEDDRHAALREVLAEPSRIAPWLAATSVPIALRRHRRAWTPEALVRALRPLTPRLYSIASSSREVGDEVHLTVDHVQYRLDGIGHRGTASGPLADLGEEGTVRAFVQPNEHFRLPDDPDAPIIMIGAGTGIAPFRGFLQERIAQGAKGRAWLLFGAQRFASDFLYQAEWLKARKQGQLDRIDLAFSRDQIDKVYVQQRVREQSARLRAWIDEGAHVYVCGSIAMGQAVHAALCDVLRDRPAIDGETAEQQLRALQQQGRYSRDVY